MSSINWSELKGAAEKWRDELRFAERVLELVSAAQAAEQVIGEAEGRKAEAEAGYRQAYADQQKALESIEALKAKYSQLNAELSEAYTADADKSRQLVLEANLAAQARIDELKAEVEKAVADAAQAIASAEVERAEVEARVEVAKKALAALKGA